MGASASGIVGNAKEWSWGRVLNVIHNYRLEEHDFVIGKSIVMRLTGLDEKDTESLTSNLPQDNQGNVNALSLLITLILIVENSSQPSLMERYTTIFNLFDFECKGKIHSDELTILLSMLFVSSNAILNKKEDIPPISVVSKLTNNAFENVGKRSNMLITRDEFLSWAQEMYEIMLKKDYETVINIIRDGGPIIPIKTKKERRKSRSHSRLYHLKTYQLEDIYILKRFIISRKLQLSCLSYSSETKNISQSPIMTYNLDMEDFYENYAFLQASNKDLFLIKKSGTVSKRTEMIILTATSEYKEASLQVETSLDETDNTFSYLLTSERDLVVIRRRGSDSHVVEVHILTAKSNYQEFSLQKATPLFELLPDEETVFLMAPNNDIVIVKIPNIPNDITTDMTDELGSVEQPPPLSEPQIEVTVLSAETSYHDEIMSVKSPVMSNMFLPGYDYSYVLDSQRNIIIIRSLQLINLISASSVTVGEVSSSTTVDIFTLSYVSGYKEYLETKIGSISAVIAEAEEDDEEETDIAQTVFLNNNGGQCEFNQSDRFLEIAPGISQSNSVSLGEASEEVDDEDEVEQIVEFSEALLKISRIEANGLKHAEMFGGKNDPYVKISFVNKQGWNPQTATHWDGGNDLHWDLHHHTDDWTVQVSKEDLTNDMLHVEVFDDNNILSDKCMGDAEVSLQPLADIGPSGKTHFLHVQLLESKNKEHRGNIVLACSLEKLYEVSDS